MKLLVKDRGGEREAVSISDIIGLVKVKRAEKPLGKKTFGQKNL